jgi:single-strand DNA-binding protein
MSINKVILVGHVGKDPVVRYFDKGVALATFPLATSDTYTNQQGETITSTEWHNIVLWRALAEVAEKTIKKGAQVYIVGKIKTRSYVDKEGVNKYTTEILGDMLLVLEKKTQRSDVQTGQTVNEPAASYQSISDSSTKAGHEDFGPDTHPENTQNEDDLPF